MSAKQHYAHTLPYHSLSEALHQRVEKGLVFKRKNSAGLELFHYTPKCVQEEAWDEITSISTGLILDPYIRRVIGTTFPKIHDYANWKDKLPDDINIEAYEKMDGAQVTLFFSSGRWQVCGRKSFVAPHLKWSEECLSNMDLTPLGKQYSYILEAVSPATRGIVHYGEKGLWMLGGYGPNGYEVVYPVLQEDCTQIGDMKCVLRYRHQTLDELLRLADAATPAHEGFIVCFPSTGKRIKIEGAGYKQVRKTLESITPLSIWNAMKDNKKLSELRNEVPVQYWDDFNQMVFLIQQKLHFILGEVKSTADKVSSLSDKQIGSEMSSIKQDHVKRLLFPYRRMKSRIMQHKKVREVLFRFVRPNGNILKGYTPCFAMYKTLERQWENSSKDLAA